MPDISNDVILLLQYLLPGFLVAWIFYGLIPQAKPSEFERVVQALIFALLVKVAMLAVRAVTLFCGRWLAVGTWTGDTELVWSPVLAISLGLLFVALANSDRIHERLRTWGLFHRSASPSEWYRVLSHYPRYIILKLQDGRYLYGWPQLWPADQNRGHFYMVRAAWVQAGDTVELKGEGVLIRAADVVEIEFLKLGEHYGQESAADR